MSCNYFTDRPHQTENSLQKPGPKHSKALECLVSVPAHNPTIPPDKTPANHPWKWCRPTVKPDGQRGFSTLTDDIIPDLCVHSHTYCHHYDKGLILAVAPVLCFVLATVCSFTQTISDLMIKNKIEMLSIATACAAVRTRNNQVVNLLWYIPGQQEFTSRRKSLLARSAANACEQFNSGVV